MTETGLADFNQALLLLDKMALYLGDSKQINRDVVELCSSGSLASKIFDCTEAIGSGQWEQALVLLQTLWTHRESPLAVLALLLRHYRILLKAVENPRLWGQRQEMARILGVPPFAVERYVKQARDYQRADLLGLWELFAQTDRRLKSSPSVKEWELEQLVFDLRQRKGAQQAIRN